MRTFTFAVAALAMLAMTAQNADAQVIVRYGTAYPAYNTYYAPAYSYGGYAAPAYGYAPYRYGYGYGGYPAYGYGGSGVTLSTGNFAFSYGTPAYGYGGYGGPRYYGRRWR